MSDTKETPSLVTSDGFIRFELPADDCLRFELPASDARSRLHLAESFYVEMLTPRPHWWFRLWQWLLLGWTWEDLS